MEMYRKVGPYKYLRYAVALNLCIRAYVKPSFLVLDAGCGWNSWHLVSTSAEGIGLDVRRENLKKARRAANNSPSVSFVVGDVEKMPFRQNIFNLIFCSDVLEHVQDWEKAIEELARTLRIGGKLLITASNSLNPTMLIDKILPRTLVNRILREFGVFYYDRTRHLNPWYLIRKMAKTGLVDRKMLMFGFPLFGYSNGKHPIERHRMLCFLWILFERLSNNGYLRYFKEIMLVSSQNGAEAFEK